MIVQTFLLNLPRLTKRLLVVLADFLICALSVWLSFGLRLDQWGLLQNEQWWAFLAATTFSLPLFIYFGQYRAIIRYSGSDSLASMVRVFVTYAALFFSIFCIMGVNGVPRSIGVIQPMIMFIGLGLSRYLVRNWLLADKHNNNKLIQKKIKRLFMARAQPDAN